MISCTPGAQQIHSTTPVACYPMARNSGTPAGNCHFRRRLLFKEQIILVGYYLLHDTTPVACYPKTKSKTIP